MSPLGPGKPACPCGPGGPLKKRRLGILSNNNIKDIFTLVIIFHFTFSDKDELKLLTVEQFNNIECFDISKHSEMTTYIFASNSRCPRQSDVARWTLE